METFLKELTHFCSDFVDVLNLNSADSQDNLIAFKKSLVDNQKSKGDIKSLYKSKNKIVITTPNQAVYLFEKQCFTNSICESKVNHRVNNI